jgi:hypothetical protein
VATNELDLGADYLVRELGRRAVPVVRLNAERGPEWQVMLRPQGEWSLERGERSLRSEDCAGVWWRRPEIPQQPPELADFAEAVGDQWRALIRSLVLAPGPVWVSEPDRIDAAETKALQLQRALAVGLLAPETLWTNDIEQARAFVSACGGRVVVKSVATAAWERDRDGYFVFASLVGDDELPSAERLAAAPICFQQPIVPKRDIRVTVVGGAVLGAIRDADADAGPIDWRHTPEAPWASHELSAELQAQCLDLVRGLGLRFSGIDFALDDDGRYWFLELNANGEWGWLQEAGLPIAEALADALLAGAPVAQVR